MNIDLSDKQLDWLITHMYCQYSAISDEIFEREQNEKDETHEAVSTSLWEGLHLRKEIYDALHDAKLCL